MATSSEWGARPIRSQERDLICPLCLEQLNVPRLTTCLHSFCTKCLNSHILNTATKVSDVYSFYCPVCRTNIRTPFRDKSEIEWTDQFPLDATLASMLPVNQSIVDTKCEPCSVQEKSIVADYFCTSCKEALCLSCYKYHKSSKISKDHQIPTFKEMFADPKKAVAFFEKLRCTDHWNKEYEYFCEGHDEICCGICRAEKHKECKHVILLKTHVKAVINKSRTGEILEKMKQLEKHLVNISEIKKQNVPDLESDIKKQLSELSSLRQTINTFLDKMERCINEEGTRILKEQSIKYYDENQTLQSLLAAIKNSHKLLETVSTHSTDIQICVVLHKMEHQLLHYQKQASDCSKKSKVNFNLHVPTCLQEITTQVETALSSVTITEDCQIIPLQYDTVLLMKNDGTSKQGNQTADDNSVSRVSKVTEGNPQNVSSKKPSATIDLVKLREVKVGAPKHGKEKPGYCGIVCLKYDSILFLDRLNLRCSLYDSNFCFIADYNFTSQPARVCIVREDEVAISFVKEKNIQFLAVGNKIRSIRSISTKHVCRGIAAVSSNELVVSGPLNDDSYYWGVMDMQGKMKSSFYIAREDKTIGSGTYVALNSSKTRVYISCCGNKAVYCFGLSGRKYFEVTGHTLTSPSYITVGRDDTLYVLDEDESRRIHLLSPIGLILHVTTSGIPDYPWALCLNSSRNKLFLTAENDANPDLCYIYQIN
ncbi:hypothetical protein CHS0354_021608 [Potamilus streckersoni]|uniref:Uncharacterized protein n=1 Tax=Potamilus streckersoni TaxID=2493646 RepID=A0AAE0SP75_9BIVA|nr:hypothetical protein CHS0354_021608 [Potamilus streckersoni]